MVVAALREGGVAALQGIVQPSDTVRLDRGCLIAAAQHLAFLTANRSSNAVFTSHRWSQCGTSQFGKGHTQIHGWCSRMSPGRTGWPRLDFCCSKAASSACAFGGATANLS